MHVVATDPDHVEQVDQSDDDRGDGHQHPRPVAEPPPPDQPDPDDESGQQQRQPQRVRRHEVPQVGGALRPPRRPRRLGQGRRGDEEGVVGHPEDLVGHRQRQRGGQHGRRPADPAAATGPTGRCGERHQDDDEDRGRQGQLGADQRAEPGHDGGGGGTPAAVGDPHQQQEGSPQPQEDHRHLEPGGGELPDAGDAGHHQQAERQDGPLVVPGTQADHGGTAGHEPTRGADQSEHHRGPLERGPGRDAVHGGEREHPQRVGVDLDPLPHVEDRAVPGQEVVDDPEVDEGVLVHPPVGPGPDEHDGQRDQHRPPGPEAQDGPPARWGRSVGRPRAARRGPGRDLGVPPVCDGGDGSGGGPRPGAPWMPRCTILAMATRGRRAPWWPGTRRPQARATLEERHG